MQRDLPSAQSIAPSTPSSNANAFIKAYREACAQTDQLFACIRPEFLTVRPVAERHRMLFYIGHLEAFDWNLLSGRLLHQAPFNPDFDRLFAFGIDPVGGGLPTDLPEDWPAIGAIHAYRDEVRQRIENAIRHVDFSHGMQQSGTDAATQADDTSPAVLLNFAIEHRQMHAETLAYLMHQMPLVQKVAPIRTRTPLAATQTRPPTAFEPGAMTHVADGRVSLGLRPSARVADADITELAEIQFGWDNEFGEHVVDVPAFLIDTHMVSNAEFLAFVQAGGYSNSSFWTPADWAWKTSIGLEHPGFWLAAETAETDGFSQTPATQRKTEWLQRTMFDLRPLPLDWPVYVSHAEANAYAKFVGKRLPTEAEWVLAAEGVALSEGNFGFRDWDPQSVKAWPTNRSRRGVHGQFGNGWEWTSDTFAPFSGFRPFSFYPGYSADFFDDRHFVMKGGSARTASNLLRPTFRNWFQPHYPYVYAGFRCAVESPTAETGSKVSVE